METCRISSYPRNWHKRDRLIKGKIALGQRQLCRDRHKCSTYPRYRDNEVRLYVIKMDKSKGCKLNLVPNNKRKCDAIYKYLLLDITMVISNPIRIRVNPTVTPAATPIQKIEEWSFTTVIPFNYVVGILWFHLIRLFLFTSIYYEV